MGVKNRPASAEDLKRHGFDPWVRKILEESTATHSSIPAWRIPWTEEPGGLQSLGSQRVRHGTEATEHTHNAGSIVPASERYRKGFKS